MLVTAPTILTERLRLRSWREDDFEPFAAYFGDPVLARFVGGPDNADAAWRRLASYIGHWVLHGFGYWAVEERRTRRFVGAAGLWRSSGWPDLELGYWLVPEMHGHGYATEAAGRAMSYAFRNIGVGRLVSYIHPDNGASQRVAKRLGARYESTIELLDFGPHDVYRYPKPPERWTLGALR